MKISVPFRKKVGNNTRGHGIEPLIIPATDKIAILKRWSKHNITHED